MEKLRPSEPISQLKSSETPQRSIIRGVLHKIFDPVRTSPFGIAMTSMGILEATLIHGIIDHFSAPFPYTMAPSIAIPISIGGIKIITDHYDLRGRLERSCQESGYTERVFELTTKAWCNRQIARIVAKRYGKLQEYEDLCKKNRATSAFPNVPHF